MKHYQRRGIPLRADPRALIGQGSSAFARSCIAVALAGKTGDPGVIASALYPNDDLTRTVIKAATGPATLDNPQWAGALGRSVIADLFGSDGLGEASAAANIFDHALRLTFNINAETKAAEVHIPHFVAEHGNAGFFTSGNPIPVHQLALTKPDVLVPHFIGAIMILTSEMIRSSNAVPLVLDVAGRSLGRALDEILVDANPADQERPAGLRFGVAATPASTAINSEDAFLADMGALADAVSPIAANSPLCFVASPGRALKIKLRMPRDLDGVYVYGSNAVQNDLLCVVPAALAVIVGDTPRIEASGSAVIETDTASRSMYQVDDVAEKIVLPCTWSKRDPRAFAWTTPGAW
jgi:hypothetical protein